MANSKGGHRAGGGIASRVNVSRGYKTGQPAHRKNVKAISQIGSAMGDHTTEHSRSLDRDDVVEKADKGVMGGMGSVPLGNEVSANTKCGPGGSRTVLGSGTQAKY